MKILLFLILINVFFQSLFSQSEWKWVAPHPPYKMVYSSVVIENKAYFWCEDNSVIKLDILNEKFEMLPIYSLHENVSLGAFTEQGLAFTDSLNGYIADIAYGEYRTTNGGHDWIKTANSGSNIHLVTFGTKLRGWKLGGGGFYITNNSGLNWTLIQAPFFGGYGYFSKLYALNENQIWVLKSFHYSGNEGSIWYSSNGGYNWNKINTGLTSDTLNQVKYIDFKMNPSGIGLAVGSIYRPDIDMAEGFIQMTTDMGTTWSITKFQNEKYKNILSINDNEWVILGNTVSYNTGQVIQRKTTNMGNSWLLSTPLQGFYNSSFFYNAIYASAKDAIFMFASFGIYKSTDKGSTYTKVTSEMDVLVSEIVFDSKSRNNDEQIAVAWLKWKKPYLISFDGGYTWTQKSLPQSMGYIWLVGIAEEVIYMIVDQTQLYKSTDYGDTWQQLNVPIYGGLQALSVYNKDVLVLKAYKYIVSSTDGGNTWIMGPTVENLWLEETDIINPGTIVGVGSFYDTSGRKGSFFRTTNFGFTWHITDTDYELKQMQMIDNNTGYALGNKFYKTTDSGSFWKVLLSGSYSAFAFIDSLNGILSAGSGFQKTTNGGVSWINTNPRIPLRSIDKLKYNAKGDLFAIGGATLLMFPAEKNGSSNTKNIFKDINYSYNLIQNYPNPFNPTTKIKFTILDFGFTSLKIYDALGNEIATLVNEEKHPGEYEVEFDGSKLSSGVYFYQLKAGSFIQTHKMVLMR